MKLVDSVCLDANGRMHTRVEGGASPRLVDHRSVSHEIWNPSAFRVAAAMGPSTQNPLSLIRHGIQASNNTARGPVSNQHWVEQHNFLACQLPRRQASETKGRNVTPAPNTTKRVRGDRAYGRAPQDRITIQKLRPRLDPTVALPTRVKPSQN